MAGKISEYTTEQTTLDDTDRLDVSTDLAGTPTTKYLSWGSLKTQLGTAGFLSSGDVDLGYTASTRTVTNTGGDDTTLPLFTSTEAGLVPLSGGGTTNFLRADGTWTALAGDGNGIYSADDTILANRTVTLNTGVNLTFDGVDFIDRFKIVGNGGTGVGMQIENQQVGAGSWKMYVGGTSAAIGGGSLGLNDDTTNRISIQQGGDVGIGVFVPSAKLHVNGDTRIDGDLTVNVGAGTIFSITDSDDSFALGLNATTDGTAQVSVGQNSDSSGSSAGIAIGLNAAYNGDGLGGWAGIAIGQNAGASTTTFDNGVIMIGSDAGGTTAGIDSICIGSSAIASDPRTIAIGDRAEATGNFSASFGLLAKSTAQYGVSIGYNANTTAQSAYLIHSDNTVCTNSTANSFGVGFDADTTPRILLAKTADSYLNGTGSFLIGANTYAGAAKMYINGDLEINGTTTASSSGSSGNFLQIIVGGTTYKLDLHTV